MGPDTDKAGPLKCTSAQNAENTSPTEEGTSG